MVGQCHRADICLHGFPGRAVPGVTAVLSRRIVFLIAQVRGKIAFHGTLENSLDQVTEHRPLAGEPQPAIGVSRPFQKSIQHLVAEQVPQYL